MSTGVNQGVSGFEFWLSSTVSFPSRQIWKMQTQKMRTDMGRGPRLTYCCGWGRYCRFGLHKRGFLAGYSPIGVTKGMRVDDGCAQITTLSLFRSDEGLCGSTRESLPPC